MVWIPNKEAGVNTWFEQFEFAALLDMWKRDGEDVEDGGEDDEDDDCDWNFWEDGPSGGWDEWEGEVFVSNAILHKDTSLGLPDKKGWIVCKE